MPEQSLVNEILPFQGALNRDHLFILKPNPTHFNITSSLVLSYLLFSVKIFVFMGVFWSLLLVVYLFSFFFFLVLLLSNAQICSRIWLSLGIKNRTIKENQKITVFVQLKSVQKTY